MTKHPPVINAILLIVDMDVRHADQLLPDYYR